MRLRRDPLAASAAAIVNIESICRQLGHPDSPTEMAGADVSGLVCTVGDVSVWPGASNVIPGQVGFGYNESCGSDVMSWGTWMRWVYNWRGYGGDGSGVGG